MYIYFTFWVITLYCVVYFVDQIVPALAIRSSLWLASFDMSPSIFFVGHFLPFWYHKGLQAHLLFYLPKL